MRIQKFTAGIIIAEKEERDKDKKIAKGGIGYDPEVWIESKGNIRDERKDTESSIEVIAPCCRWSFIMCRLPHPWGVTDKSVTRPRLEKSNGFVVRKFCCVL